MNFGFTEEQEFLRSEIQKFIRERTPLDQAREAMESASGYDGALWKEVGGLGWLGLLVPESHGGAGLGWVDLVVVLEEAGRGLLPSPLLSTSVSAGLLGEHASDAQKERWLPGIADGSSIFSLALMEKDDVFDPASIRTEATTEGQGVLLEGEKRFVSDATAATHFLVSCRHDGELVLAVVEADAPGVTVTDLPCIDRSKRLGKVVFQEVQLGADTILAKRGEGVVERAFDCATVAVTAEAIGAAEGAHALLVEYANNRIQFGSLIGRFQGVKHPLAEMYVDIESFKSLLYYAAWCLDEEPGEVARHASMAKAYANDAFTRIGMDCVELHGAIGYTWEYDAQLYLKRSKWVKSMFGSSDYHYDRVAKLGGL